MKSFNWKSLIPHLIAVGIFLVVALLFCHSALESNTVIQQGDMAGTQGMTQQSFEYQKIHGAPPLWTTNMFAGMPAFQIIFSGPYNPITTIDKIFQLGLPKPVNYFFLLSIGFYILTVCFGIRTWVGIISSLAYAYCLYDPIIAVVGHQTKILAMAYAPAVLGGVYLIFEKQYLKGFIVTALFMSLHLEQNHTQISYYLFLVIGLMALAYLIQWIKRGDVKHVFSAAGISLAAVVIGIVVNAVTIFTVYDYINSTKRGGQLIMGDKKTSEKLGKDSTTVGSSKEYAFMWSYGRAESMSLLFPGVMGYGYHGSERDGETKVYPSLDDKSHVAEYLNEKVGSEQGSAIAPQLSGNLYWGDQPFTSGPVYLGAVVCFLFLFGLFYLDNKHKWWILTISVLGILMALGKNFPLLNNFLFDHLPFYNKFRVPTLTLFIPQLMFPIMGALALDKLIDNPNEEAWKKLRLTVFATLGVFAVAIIMYFSLDFSKENKQRTSAFNAVFTGQGNEADIQSKMDAVNAKYQPEADNQLYENFVMQSKGDKTLARGVLDALHKDRASLFAKDIFRSFIFIALAVVVLGLFIKKKIKEGVMIAGIGLLSLIDLLSLGTQYLNKTSFANKEDYQNKTFDVSPADQEILKDKDPNFRVFNYAGGDPFQESKTSYFHKSIGGYHPAKLALYDDLITYQLSGKLNEQVINMLNTKYIIQNNPQTKQPMAIPNAGALGNCWFVKGITFVDGPSAEMRALDAFNPRDTAIVDVKYKADLASVTPADSMSSIKQTAFDNDAIKYESNASAPHLAIFSEIFYKDWNASIDGAPAKVIKANYLLRGLVVPAGKHVIDFKFEPKVFLTSSLLATIASWFLVLLIVAYAAWELIFKKKKNVAIK